MDIAILAGGCFWCLEAIFENIKGVGRVCSGYCGGSAAEANYESVCTGNSRHAECVLIEYDAGQVSFTSLLQVFFQIHDPTTPDRQGYDVGPQYRSVIFAQTEQQRETALKVMAEVQPQWPRPIVTQIEGKMPFFPAEDYHQSYYRENSWRPYCEGIIAPKIRKVRSIHSDLWKV